MRLRAEWLQQQLATRVVLGVHTARDNFRVYEDLLAQQQVEICFCKGKHIFIVFNNGYVLHNHLLMRGKWRSEHGQFLLVPHDLWLGLYLGEKTICNYHGQVLELITRDQMRDVMATIGPDVMQEPFPESDISRNMTTSELPIAEFLLDQKLIAGVGNVARSEILYAAGVAPEKVSQDLNPDEIEKVCFFTRKILYDSYNKGGRWVHRVYRCSGDRCSACGNRIRMTRLLPGKRSIYFCPACQV